MWKNFSRTCAANHPQIPFVTFIHIRVVWVALFFLSSFWQKQQQNYTFQTILYVTNRCCVLCWPFVAFDHIAHVLFSIWWIRHCFHAQCTWIRHTIQMNHDTKSRIIIKWLHLGWIVHKNKYFAMRVHLKSHTTTN